MTESCPNNFAFHYGDSTGSLAQKVETRKRVPNAKQRGNKTQNGFYTFKRCWLIYSIMFILIGKQAC